MAPSGKAWGSMVRYGRYGGGLECALSRTCGPARRSRKAIGERQGKWIMDSRPVHDAGTEATRQHIASLSFPRVSPVPAGWPETDYVVALSIAQGKRGPASTELARETPEAAPVQIQEYPRQPQAFKGVVCGHPQDFSLAEPWQASTSTDWPELSSCAPHTLWGSSTCLPALVIGPVIAWAPCQRPANRAGWANGNNKSTPHSARPCRAGGSGPAKRSGTRLAAR
ncbi:hypothetical protein QBC43DRAFT_330669 [Cladorrhinum sp. PSN259]|nr:hypothetical protein QBC43DRAFT_330669 [Cladorrhinum sp. PSN259]